MWLEKNTHRIQFLEQSDWYALMQQKQNQAAASSHKAGRLSHTHQPFLAVPLCLSPGSSSQMYHEKPGQHLLSSFQQRKKNIFKSSLFERLTECKNENSKGWFQSHATHKKLTGKKSTKVLKNRTTWYLHIIECSIIQWRFSAISYKLFCGVATQPLSHWLA